MNRFQENGVSALNKSVETFNFHCRVLGADEPFENLKRV